MTIDEVWFSHREKRYKTRIKLFSIKKFLIKTFSWTDNKEIWDWDHCTIGLARAIDDRLIVVVRSKTNTKSRYMGKKPVELRYMLGFEVNNISEPYTESYTARENHPDPEKRVGPNKRLVFQLDSDHWIWEWAKEGEDINSSIIYRLYNQINNEMISSSIKSDNIFKIGEKINHDDRIIPVIYQPAVDSLDNFVREVHCKKKKLNANGSYEVEVTIIFENEKLREHFYLNKAYELIRLHWLYGRKYDIESFKILDNKGLDNKKFIFKGIYSNGHNIIHGDIHGDKESHIPHNIKYFFMDNNHPVVFINTSNHAMAEHDTNHELWKWEYIPWLENAPVKCGSMSREEIDSQFISYWKRLVKLIQGILKN